MVLEWLPPCALEASGRSLCLLKGKYSFRNLLFHFSGSRVCRACDGIAVVHGRGSWTSVFLTRTAEETRKAIPRNELSDSAEEGSDARARQHTD